MTPSTVTVRQIFKCREKLKSADKEKRLSVKELATLPRCTPLMLGSVDEMLKQYIRGIPKMSSGT